MNSILPFRVPYLRWAEILHTPIGWLWGPRCLYDHELVYVKSGVVEMKIGAQHFVAEHDQLFLIPPRTTHLFRCPVNQDSVLIGIHFDWENEPGGNDLPVFRPAVEPYEENLFRTPHGVPHWNYKTSPLLNLRGRPRVLQLLQEAVTAYSSAGEYSAVMAGSLLAAAIAQMSHEAVLLRDVENNPRLGADAVRRVHRAREVLEAPRSKPVSVEDVARSVGWSADHLGRMCREVLGVAPYRLQTQARLRRAMEMLRYRDATINEVALRCGYPDASNFADAFKRETGLTPRQFLKLETNAPSSK